MIFPTTFILTLFFAQIARSVPQACGDSIPPKSSTRDGQYNLAVPAPVRATFKAVYNPIYDNPSESVNNVACSELVTRYPTFGDVPLFPTIGGAINTTYNSPNCGAVWRIINPASGVTIYFLGIDDSSSLDLSLESFVKIGGSTATGSVEVEADIVWHI
jgi:Cerato-platanin